jgi:hypothetical protein
LRLLAGNSSLSARAALAAAMGSRQNATAIPLATTSRSVCESRYVPSERLSRPVPSTYQSTLYPRRSTLRTRGDSSAPGTASRKQKTPGVDRFMVGIIAPREARIGGGHADDQALISLIALGALDGGEALAVGRRVLGGNAAGIYGLPWP